MRFSRTFGYPTDVIEARFWSKVQKTDTCWLWIGKGGEYGRLNVKPRGPFRSMPAHRVAYVLLVGPIPVGMTIDHLCRVKRCVRPDHMEVVTLEENGRRGYEFQMGVIE